MQEWSLIAGAMDLDGLVLAETRMPEPGPGEICVRVSSASLNYRERLALTDPAGWRKDKAIIHVADVAGEFDAVGPGVET